MVMLRSFFAWTCAALLATGLVACDTESSQSECHKRMVQRLGCCPLCDAECRGSIDAECANEARDEPLDHEPVNGETTTTDDEEPEEPEEPPTPQ